MQMSDRVRNDDDPSLGRTRLMPVMAPFSLTCAGCRVRRGETGDGGDGGCELDRMRAPASFRQRNSLQACPGLEHVENSVDPGQFPSRFRIAGPESRGNLPLPPCLLEVAAAGQIAGQRR